MTTADLFKSGIANSLFAVSADDIHREAFAIKWMEDLDIENFKSLSATTAFVLKKNGRAAA